MIVSNTADAIQKMSQWNPLLIILDYAEKQIDKVEFLNHFIESTQPMQLMLVLLQSSGPAIVYERHSISLDQIVEWLDLSWMSEKQLESQPSKKLKIDHFLSVARLENYNLRSNNYQIGI